MNKFSSLIILITALFLPGCVTTAVICTAAISTKVAIDPRTLGTQLDDSTLELRVKIALLKNKQLKKKAHINVVAYQGKVLLVGQISDLNLLSLAKKIAMNVKGTTEVYNEIRYDQHNQPFIDLISVSSDAWITAKIRSCFLTDKRIKSYTLKVVTENGEVFLLGLVTENEGKVAADIASRINGVKRVTTAFTYL